MTKRKPPFLRDFWFYGGWKIAESPIRWAFPNPNVQRSTGAREPHLPWSNHDFAPQVSLRPRPPYRPNDYKRNLVADDLHGPGTQPRAGWSYDKSMEVEESSYIDTCIVYIYVYIYCIYHIYIHIVRPYQYELKLYSQTGWWEIDSWTKGKDMLKTLLSFGFILWVIKHHVNTQRWKNCRYIFLSIPMIYGKSW